MTFYNIGKKIVDYYGNKKEIVSVFIGEGNDRYINYDGILYAIDKEIKEGEQYIVQVGDIDRKTYEEIAKEIATRIYLLIDSDDYDRCFWVSGYDVGGAIASEVSRNLIKENSEEVYCYTFGVPNTSSIGSESFANIKNIINADDLNVRFEAGSKPGQVYMLSIYEDLMNEYKDITGSNNYRGNYLYTNYVVDVFKKFVRDGINMSIQQKKAYIESMSKYLVDYEKFRNKDLFTEEAREMLIAMNECAEGNKQAHSIKSYYVLAKSINGFDLIDYDYSILEKYNKKYEPPETSEMSYIMDDIDQDTDIMVMYSGKIIKYNNEYEKLYTFDSNKSFNFKIRAYGAIDVDVRSPNIYVEIKHNGEILDRLGRNFNTNYPSGGTYYKISDGLSTTFNTYDVKVEVPNIIGGAGTSMPLSNYRFQIQQHQDITYDNLDRVEWVADNDSIYVRKQKYTDLIYAENENQINDALYRDFSHYLYYAIEDDDENIIVDQIEFWSVEGIIENVISSVADSLVPGSGNTLSMFFQWYSDNKPTIVDCALYICKKVSKNYTKPFVLKRFHDISDNAYIFDAEEWKETNCVKGPKGMVGSFNNY